MDNKVVSDLENQISTPSTPEETASAVTSEEVFPSTATKTTGEPNTDQAPTVITASAVLPADYTKGGFMDTAPNGQRSIKVEYVGRFAQELAAALTTVTPALTAAAFNAAFLRDAKKHLRRGVIYGAKATCAAAMLPAAIKLVAKHKAPPLLQDMISTAVGAVFDDATFEALYKHLDAVYSFMLQNEQQKGGDT